MADQFSGLDTRANRTRKIVHTCDLQHTCHFAHEKDWEGVQRCNFPIFLSAQIEVGTDQ